MKKFKIFIFAAILFVYALSLTHQIDLPYADDMARHIKNGEMVLRGDFSVLYQNVYSYTEPSHQFINHHWLSGVVFYILHQTIGWGGLVVFKVIVLLSTFALLFATAIKKSNFWLAAGFSLFAVIILSGRTALRPEIFSYLFIAVFLYLLDDFERNPQSKKIFWLIPLQLIWANMHVFFFIGPLLAAGFLFEKIILHIRNLFGNPFVKKLSLLLICLLAVSFINPNGAAGALYPLNIFGNYGMDVSENNSLHYFFRVNPPYDNIDKYAFAAAAGLLALSFLFNIKKKPVFYFAAAATTTIVGFKMLRGLPLFAFIFLPAISANFYPLFSRLAQKFKDRPLSRQNAVWISGALFAAALIFSVYLILSPKLNPYRKYGLGLANGSENTAEFLKQSGLPGPIFNDYDIGSYLIYYLYPQEKVFIDNRPEAYSSNFIEDTYQKMIADEASWREGMEKYEFNSIVFYRYNRNPEASDFIYRRAADPGWALVFADQYAVIFAFRNELNGNIIEKYEITAQNVQEKMDRFLKSDYYDEVVAAADTFNLMGVNDLGRQTFFRVVNRWPHRGKIWMVMGEWEYLNVNENPKSALLAIAYLERALTEGYRTAEVYTFLGGTYLWLGFEEQARAYLEESYKINPYRKDTKEMLDSINKPY